MINARVLLAGEWRQDVGSGFIEVENPATGEIVGRVPVVPGEEVSRCIEAADRVFEEWAARAPAERGALLRAASSLVFDRAEEIARTMTMEQGKPFAEALGEVKKGAEILRYYAEEGERVYGRIIANDKPGIESHVEYEAVGVAFAVSPWNYPIELLAWKVGGALAAGCTLVAKVPTVTPLSPLYFVEAVVDAGAPPGVLSAVAGSAREIGAVALADPRVKKVAFTGSTAVGREILAGTVDTLKKVSLELGGSLPMVVCDDSDVDAAVVGATRRSFRNMGQICIAVNRIYVQRSIYEKFVARFAEKAEALVIGDGLTDRCDLGAMATEDGLQRAERHIADAVEKGARLVSGGGRPEGEKYAAGRYFRPTVLADASHEMLVMSEETFGPVVGVMPFDDLDDAVTLANDSPYGLAAIVFTRSLSRARYLSRRIRAGNVAVNNVDAGVINAPYGGWKDSGFGYEHGPEGLYEYLRAKHVRIQFDQ